MHSSKSEHIYLNPVTNISSFVFQGMVPPPAHQLTCPKCKQDSTLRQAEAENLTTNVYALNIVQLKNLRKNKQLVSHGINKLRVDAL